MRARQSPLALDNLGFWASFLCVVHCLLTPVILSLSAVTAHFLPSEERTHRALAILVAAIGIAAIARGFRRHRRWLVVLLASVGLSLIWGAALWGSGIGWHWGEVLITIAGSLCLISAHRLNHTFCLDCTCSHEGESKY